MHASPPASTPRSHVAAWILVAVLALGGLVATGLGSLRLAHGDFPSGTDLHLRWVEQRNVVHGQNPGTISADAVPPYEQPDQIEDGLLVSTSYPPYAYITQMPFVWLVPWPAARLVFLAWTLAALVLISCWAHAQFRSRDSATRTAAVLLPWAIWPTSYCLSGGQYAILLTALLAGAFLLLQRGREAWAGVAVAFALLKPTLIAPFLLIFLLDGRWLLLAVAAVINIAATFAAWAITRCDPLTLLRQAQAHVWHNRTTTQNLVTQLELHLPGFSPGLQTAITLAIGFAGAALIWLARRLGCGLLTQAGIAAVIALSWTYRKEYDAVLILFLVVALLRVALATGRGLARLCLVLMAAPLLTPFRLADHNSEILQGFELLTWLAAVACCLAWDRPAGFSSRRESA